MNKTVKIMLILAATVAIGGLIYWYNSPSEDLGEVKSGNSININVTNDETSVEEAASLPRIIITSPRNNEPVYSDVVVVRYQLLGDIAKVLNVDLTLNSPDNPARHFVSDLEGGSSTGVFPLTNLKDGQYSLRVRLRNMEGNFYYHPGAVQMVSFTKAAIEISNDQ